MTLASYGNQLHHDIVLSSHRATRNASTSPATSPALEASIASPPSFKLIRDYIFGLLVRSLSTTSLRLPTDITPGVRVLRRDLFNSPTNGQIRPGVAWVHH